MNDVSLNVVEDISVDLDINEGNEIDLDVVETSEINIEIDDDFASFDSLLDTPASKTGSALKIVRVNSGGNALEYVDPEVFEDVNWGEITGTLSDQTDLQAALDLKTDETDFQAHTGDLTIHFTESSISHLNIQDIGSNSHTQIDSHIADTSIHYAQTAIDHTVIQNIGTNTHAQIDSHISNTSNPHGVTAVQVPYDNSSSTLESTNVNTAIDELDINNLQQNSTGLIAGGELSINVAPTKLDVAAGEAYFIDSYTDPLNPTATKVTWGAKIAVTPGLSGITPIEFVSIDIDGNLTYSATAPIEDEKRDCALLGILVHDVPPFTTIRKATTAPLWTQDNLLHFFDMVNTLGPSLSVSGNVYSANGTNLKIDKSSGKAYGPGFNYDIDKKNPNISSIAADTEIIFPAFWRGSPISNVAVKTEIPTDKYDPNGDGTLVNIPDGFFTIHRIYLDPSTQETVMQYGQNAYDSLKKAADSFDKEEHAKVDEVQNILCRCCIVVKQGGADLSELTEIKFINLGVLGDKNFNIIPSFSRFIESVESIDGMSYQVPTGVPVVIGDDVFGDIEALGGGDITYAFGQREYVLDCTNGDGVDGAARIQLTPGTDTHPKLNYIYVIRNGDEAILQSSTSRPTGEFAYLGTTILPTAATIDSDGTYMGQLYNDAKSFDGRGAVQRSAERLRILDAEYESGMAQTVIITPNVGVPDDVDFTMTSGEAWQKHLQDVPSRQISVNGIRSVNHPTTPYLKVFDLADIRVDANGNSLVGRRFNFIIWGAINSNTGETKLFLNLPLDTYGNDADVIADKDGTSVTSIPKDFRGNGFLVARLPLRQTQVSGGTWTNVALSELGTQVIDIRGNPVGSFAGGVSIPASSTFSDGNFLWFNNADNAKTVDVDLSNITTGNTRTLTMPDASGTIFLTSGSQAMTGNLDMGNNAISNVSTITGATLIAPTIQGDWNWFLDDGSSKCSLGFGSSIFGSNGDNYLEFDTDNLLINFGTTNVNPTYNFLGTGLTTFGGDLTATGDVTANGLTATGSVSLGISSELMTNEEFDDGSTGWTESGSWSYGNDAGDYYAYADANGEYLEQSNIVESGNNYVLNVSYIAGEFVNIYAGGVNVHSSYGTTFDGLIYFTATATGSIKIVTNEDFGVPTLKIYRLSVKKLSDIEATNINAQMVSFSDLQNINAGTSTGDNILNLGTGTDVTGNNIFTSARASTINSGDSIGGGTGHSITGDAAVYGGSGHNITKPYCNVSGRNNNCFKSFGTSLGDNVNNEEGIFGVGLNIDLLGTSSTGIGVDVGTGSAATYSGVFGQSVTNTITNSFLIGWGGNHAVHISNDWLKMPNDNQKLMLGGADDVSISFNGTDLIIKADETGTNGVQVLTSAAEQLGFHGTSPIAQQTGVVVTAVGIHAALVNLGLITA